MTVDFLKLKRVSVDLISLFMLRPSGDFYMKKDMRTLVTLLTPQPAKSIRNFLDHK